MVVILQNFYYQKVTRAELISEMIAKDREEALKESITLQKGFKIINPKD